VAVCLFSEGESRAESFLAATQSRNTFALAKQSPGN
jgi:hypothetical protein